MDGLFDSFARLDSRISSVGQTAAKIGDHLQVEFIPSLFAIQLFVWLYQYLLIVMVIHASICVDFSWQSADAERETASQTIELIKVLSVGA